MPWRYSINEKLRLYEKMENSIYLKFNIIILRDDHYIKKPTKRIGINLNLRFKKN